MIDTRVRLLSTSDMFTRLVPGNEGVVTEELDMVNGLLVKWDSGGALILLRGLDQWEELN